jgi:glycosyltransferase involved in cell wall biosynthesis
MLPPEMQPRVVTTLHGTDTTLLGRDADYGPAIRHALGCSDAVTAVSHYLQRETEELLGITRPIDVIHNFFAPRRPRRTRDEVRRELGVGSELMLLHCSNLRPVKRIDLLLETAARIRPRDAFKLVILAGEDFAPFASEDDATGILVPFGDTAALARAVEGLIKDPARCAALGRAAQARARELFSAGVIVPRYEALYRRICE